MFFRITPPRIRQLAVTGVALSLLFLGCERDEVQQPSSPTLTQQEAMNLFFKNYQRHKDDYCDAVAENLLAMNDSTGIIFNLVHRFGHPRWEVERSSASKSTRRLFVPVVVPGVDSVSAVFIFLDSANITQLKVAAWTNPDTLVRDFVMQYQCHLYGRSGVAGRYAERLNPGTKDWEVWEYCTNTCTSRDGHTCYEVIYSSCSYSLVWVGAEDTEISFISDKTLDEGGGGDTGGPSDPQGDTCQVRGMLHDELNTVSLIRDNIMANGHCPTDKIMKATSRQVYEINPCMGSGAYGQFTLSLGRIQFRSAEEVTEARLYEETMHAYQDLFYNGLGQYGPGKAGYTNMEFEAKVMYAIYWYQEEILGDPVLFQGLNETEKGIFINWIEDIIIDGFTSDALYQYDTIIDIFNRKNPSYAGFISSTFPKLSVIQNLLNGCPKTY